MSKSSSASSRVPRSEVGRRPVTTLRSPADVVTVIPYLLGYEPHDSLVTVAVEGARMRFGMAMRVDLPTKSEEAVTESASLVAILQHHEVSRVVVAAFSSDEPRAGATVRPLLRGLRRARIAIHEAVRADGKRWWSYTCHGACCPASGTAYDPTTSRVAAEVVLAGYQKAPSRDALRVLFDPAPEPACALVRHACDVLVSRPRPPVSDAITAADGIIESHLDDPASLSDVEVASLIVAVCEIETRDALWSLIDREQAMRHHELWRHVMRLAPAELVAAPASLAGFAAWIAGQGTLAAHVVDRLRVIAPSYPMGRLLADTLESAVNPRIWGEMRRTRQFGQPSGAG